MSVKQSLALLSITVLCLLRVPAAIAVTEFEEDHSLPIVYLNIIVDVGSMNDPAGKLGLANVASEMLLRGTHKRDKNEFFQQLNRLGGQLDVEVRNEGTIYRAAVLSENLDKFLELVTEAFTRPKFTAEELNKLKKETEGQLLAMRGDDRSLVQYAFPRFFYGSHPYGNPPIGTVKGIEAVNHKDVIDFYADHFGGKALHLLGFGAAKRATVTAWFERLEAKLNAIHPEARPGKEVAKPEIPKTKRALIIDKPGATQSQVLLGGPGLRPEDNGFYAVQLANHSFGGGSFQARMMQELRVKRGWTYGASNSFRFGREPKHFAMWFFPKTEETVPAINLSLEMFADFVSRGVSEAEFKYAQQSLVNNAPFDYDTAKKRLENATNELLLRFPDDYFRNFSKNISQVSYDDITPSLRRHLDPGNLTLVVVGDASKLKEPISQIPGFSNPRVKNFKED